MGQNNTFFPGNSNVLIQPTLEKRGLDELVALALCVSEWDASMDTLHDNLGLDPEDGYRSPFQLLRKEQVVPDLLPTLEVHPSQFIKSTYPVHDGFSNRVGFVAGRMTLEPPQLIWDYAVGVYDTLVMMDLDCPSRTNPSSRSCAHWVVINIPNSNITAGQTVIDYIGVDAPFNSGRHRLVFLVYRQKRNLTIQKDKFFTRRVNISLPNYTYRLGLHDPIAVALFESEWDEAVDLLHDALGYSPPPEYMSPAQKGQVAEEIGY